MHVTTTASHKDRSIEFGLTGEDGARMFHDWADRDVADQVRALAAAVDLLAVRYAEGEGWISPEYAQTRVQDIKKRAGRRG